MAAMKTDFYVTLPSNASAKYFPENTQGSYRTKLSTPLILDESFQVGLSEIIIPRNWFNVGAHNNEYSITSETGQERVVDHKQYDFNITYDPDEPLSDFLSRINTLILETAREQLVKFVRDWYKNRVAINIQKDGELVLTKSKASDFLRMLHLEDEEIGRAHV